MSYIYRCLLGAFFFFPAFIAAQDYYVLEKLPGLINSTFDEITPVPSRDGRLLFFTRVGHPEFNRTLLIDSVDQNSADKRHEYLHTLADVYSQIANRSIAYPETAVFNQDVWMARADSMAAFYEVKHPEYPLNNALPNSLVSITPDPRSFYIINQFKKNGDMERGFSRIRMENDSTWTFPEAVDIEDFYTLSSEVGLTMSFDGKVLILSAARLNASDMDLYVCFRKGVDKWARPQHLGNVINSVRRETTPYLSEDNTTLFFSSNRKNGTGGNDIYMSKRLDDTWLNWSEPETLREPINSASDDSQPYFNMTTGFLYFTSKRDGNSDIYRVRIAPPQPTEMPVVGRVLNRSTGELVANAIVHYSPDGNPADAGTLATTDGTFTIKIAKGIRFDFTAHKPGYYSKPVTVQFRRDYYFFRPQYIDLYLDTLQTEGEIELKDIFFEQSRAVFLPESAPELERLKTLMLDNPGMNIMVEGHTDNRGSAEDLLALSEARALAIKEYLTGAGIAESRVRTIGFGATKPLNENQTDEERQQNRRVVVRILKI
ncbi:MAG: OmpA family protein [Saprospiraceae bacterium]|nr:OmpA family protein [Saprospiraceae bacterium]